MNPVCSAEGCGLPATDADHVASIRDQPERRLDLSNLRPFCHAHHAQRTARDQGFAGWQAKTSDTRPSPPTTRRGALHPKWMRPSRVPLAVVCGPPGADRKGYVAARAGMGDEVIDLDRIISELSGEPLFANAPAHFGEAIRERNRRLGELHSPRCPFTAAWLTAYEPHGYWRTWWHDTTGARVIVLPVPAELCHARIDADDRRPDDVKARHHEAADSWWRKFTPSPHDVMMRQWQQA